MNNLIGIMGADGVGKDTVGRILQILSYFRKKDIKYSKELVLDYLQDKNLDLNLSLYQIKKFATKAVECYKIITGIDFHDLPREEKELVRQPFVAFAEGQKKIFGDDIWCRALFADYKPRITREQIIKFNGETDYFNVVAPRNKISNWIITDVRFPCEIEAIRERGGIIIYVSKDHKENVTIKTPEGLSVFYYPSILFDTDEYIPIAEHHVTNNDGIEELIEQVRKLNIV